MPSRRALAAVLALAACDGSPSTMTPPDLGVPDLASHTGLPPLAVGADAYRFWERWPYLRLGERASMRSTFDRRGGNPDVGNFVRQDADGTFTPLDVAGPGALVFFRANHWHGSPWHFVVDAKATIASDTSSADPDHPAPSSTWQPPDLFPAPAALAWPATAGADVSWVPMPFATSLRLGYERTFYGTGYYIFDQFAEGEDNFISPLNAYSATAPSTDVTSLLARAGDDLTPTGATEMRASFAAAAGATVVLLDRDADGDPEMVRLVGLDAPTGDALALGRARLRISWDGRALPSVDAPVALLFGAGTLYDRDAREWLVRALPSTIRITDRARLAMYFPMPFFRHVRVELVADAALPDVGFTVATVPYRDPPSWVGYFHATYRDHGAPTPGQDLVLLDTAVDEGALPGGWCGHVVGTSFTFSDRADLGTLEGDPRFFFDDSSSPQVQGTGTEEWGAGGDYWQGGTLTTLPLAGHPVGAPSLAAAKTPDDAVESAYRYLLADAMPFGRRAVVGLEHGGRDESTEHYTSVVDWYGAPGACLILSDTLHVSDAADEQLHHYTSPGASTPDTLASAYELGVTAPVTTDAGRHTTQPVELTLAIPSDNVGALLRRKLDLAYPDQTADVFVDGAHAGVWRTSGGAAWVYAQSSSETGAASPVVMTGDRRWREDELLLPRALTAGKTSIRVRIVPRPAALPLVPGTPAPSTAWSEFRYWLYAYRLPPAP